MVDADVSAFSSSQRTALAKLGLNARQVVAVEAILPALRLITLPHKSIGDALRRVDEGHYVYLPHYVTLPAKGGKAPGGANPDAIEMIYRELFHIAVTPAEGDARGLSPFPRFESDLVIRQHGARSRRAVKETLLNVRSDASSAFFRIAELCYQAAGISTKPERAIRAWLARGRQGDEAEFAEPCDNNELECFQTVRKEAMQILNVKKGRPADYSASDEMFQRLRKQWVLDNPNMSKKQRREMAAGIPGLEHIASSASKPRKASIVKKKAKPQKPRSWR